MSTLKQKIRKANHRVDYFLSIGNITWAAYTVRHRANLMNAYLMSNKNIKVAE